MAQEHDMIDPYSEKQVSEGVISYGVSSYGYDLRVADEFKIFNNVNRTIVDPNHFDERSFVTVNTMSRSSLRIRLRWRGRSSTSRFPAMC
jgi:dCTP deaminase